MMLGAGMVLMMVLIEMCVCIWNYWGRYLMDDMIGRSMYHTPGFMNCM